MAMQPSGMAAWRKAIEDRDALIRQLRERRDQYVEAVNKRDDVIRGLRAELKTTTEELNQLKGAQPAALVLEATDVGPPPAPEGGEASV